MANKQKTKNYNEEASYPTKSTIGKWPILRDFTDSREEAEHIIEEAYEVLAEVERAYRTYDNRREYIALECADLVQCIVQLLASLEIYDLKPYREQVKLKNQQRGRIYRYSFTPYGSVYDDETF